MDQVFGRSRFAVLLHERGRHICYLNSACAARYGYAPAELLGLSARLLLAPTVNRRALGPIVRQIYAESTPWHGLVSHRTRQGKVLPTYVCVLPLRLEPGVGATFFLSLFADPAQAPAAMLATLDSLAQLLGAAGAAGSRPAPASPERSRPTRTNEVLRMVQLGLATKEIAHLLGIAPSTVRVLKARARRATSYFQLSRRITP